MKTKFILKTYWDNDPAYYVKILDKNYKGNTVIHLSASVNEAKKFDTPEEAEKIFEVLNNPSFKIYPVCPKCNKDYEEHPAISRIDNKSEICPDCGTLEALDSYLGMTSL